MVKRLIRDKHPSLLQTFVNYEKRFITLAPGLKIIKHFSPLLTLRTNKLKCLSMSILFQASLVFETKTSGSQ